MTFILWIYSLLLLMPGGSRLQTSSRPQPLKGSTNCELLRVQVIFSSPCFPSGAGLQHGSSQQEYSTTSAELAIDGYTCSMCGLSVEKSLLTLRYIRTVKNDLNSNIMQVEFKPGATVDPNEIARKVKESGFSIASMTYKMSDSIEVQKNPILINNVEFYFCPNDSVVKSTRLKVIGKNILPKKEFQKLTSSRCELSAHTYWLQPL